MKLDCAETLSHSVAGAEQGAVIAGKTGGAWRLALRIAFGALILAYALRFTLPSLEAGFNGDDPMNIHYYWWRGAGQLLRNLPLFFTTYQRPMGGVYFSLLYHFFGLNPLPYHVVLVFLLVLNTFLAYRFGRLISGSELTGGLTALVVAYHARLAPLVYLPAFVFDVLCFTFYFLAFTYYLSRRNGGGRLAWKQTGLFLVLYICALDSKEMAVTLPVMILIYEAIWHPPSGFSFRAAARWLRTGALPAMLAGALTALYIVGKFSGSDSLVKVEGYRPVLSWSRYWESTTRFVNTILYTPNEDLFGAVGVVLLAAVLFRAARVSGQKHLLLMSFFIWIAPLPVTFLPGRGGANLYIPLAGWAVILVTFFLCLCRAFARSRIGLVALVLLGMWSWWRWTESQDRVAWTGIRKADQLTWSVMQQVRTMMPKVKPGSRIYVVRDPFGDWEMKFIIDLVYRDRSIAVWLENEVPLPREEVRKMDYVLTFEGDRLVRLKGL